MRDVGVDPKKVFADALGLTEEQRADLAAQLLRSLPEGTKVDDLTPEQADELRRSFERGGEIPAAELLARLRR